MRLSCIACVLLLWCGPAWCAEPHLVFRTAVVVQSADGETVRAWRHTVKRGEHLWRILRREFAMQDQDIARFCALAQRLNPQLRNLDALQPGQRLLLPFALTPDNATVQTALPTAETRTLVVGPGEHLARMLRTPCDLCDRVIFDPQFIQRLHAANPHIADLDRLEVGQRLIIPLPGPARQCALRRRMQPALEQVVRALGGRALAGAAAGQYVLPGGRCVRVRYHDAAPPAATAAHVVAITPQDDIPGLIDKLVAACGFYQVQRNGAMTLHRDRLHVRLAGDWVLFHDATCRRATVISLEAAGAASLEAPLRQYLTGIGVRLVQVAPSGTVLDPAPIAVADRPARGGLSDAEVVDALLTAGGVPFERSVPSGIYQTMYAGAQHEVVLDRLFYRRGARCVIDFQGLPPRICSTLRLSGYHLLQWTAPVSRTPDTLRQLLSFCGLAAEGPPVGLPAGEAASGAVQIALPALRVTRTSAPLLFALQPLPAGLAATVRARGGELVAWYPADALK